MRCEPNSFAKQTRTQHENLASGGTAALDQPRRQTAIAGNDPERPGHCGRHRYAAARSLPTGLGPVGEKRGILPALGAVACEGDHVMGDEPDMDQLFEAAGAQRRPAMRQNIRR